MRLRIVVGCLLAVLSCCGEAAAQNWTFDARKIGIGGVGGNNNLAWDMIEEQRRYGTVVLPFGLLQVLRNTDIFRPDSDDFDIIRSIEYGAAPLHYMLDRDGSDTTGGTRLVVDIRNAELSRDLNRYRGFVPVNQPAAEGLAVPRIGGTITLARGGGAFHGIYVGAGGYVSMHAAAEIDQRLVDVLASDTDVYVPNARFQVGTTSAQQLAAVGTVGYRGRVARAGAASDREGVYLAVNYNYLRGFRHESQDVRLDLPTDGAGLLTMPPPGAAPLALERTTATSGNGFSLDAGVGVVVGRVEFGAGASGIANRINWTAAERTTYTIQTLFDGDAEFIESPATPVGELRVELPVDYRGNMGYHADSWSALAEVGHGFNGGSVRGGLEYRLGAIELRGGAYYLRERWQPTAGIGLNMGRRLGLDVATYWTIANVEREPRQVIAASLRINALP